MVGESTGAAAVAARFRGLTIAWMAAFVVRYAGPKGTAKAEGHVSTEFLIAHENRETFGDDEMNTGW